MICLDKKYSTTRLITNKQPVIKNNPEYKYNANLFLTENKDRKGEGGLRTKGYFKISLKDKKLVSVITVVYNGEKYLEETIKSIINQKYENIEYIIIDGGSTDSTIEIIKLYEDKIDYWVSEPDKGIYDAMNKGISLSMGDVICFLNSDDWYELNAISSIIKYFKKYDFIYGAVRVHAGKSIYYSRPVKEKEILKKGIQEMIAPHITFFIRKNVFKINGLFNLKYKIRSDQDFIFRMIKRNYKGLNTKIVLGNIRIGGISGINCKYLKEARDIAMGHGRSYLKANIIFYLGVLKYYINKRLSKNIIIFIKKLIKSRHL